MKKLIFLLIFFGTMLNAQIPNTIINIAKEEERRFAVPHKVILTYYVFYNTNSNLGERTNNYFKIRCHSSNCNKGHCIESGHKDFYRVYACAWQSFRDFTMLLKQRHNKLSISDDYKLWLDNNRELIDIYNKNFK